MINEKEVMKRLEAYGVDMKTTMERFVDDESLYLSCLEMFQTDEAFGGLKTAIEQNGCEGAFDCAHTLKGVAGNLGLKPLYDSICVVVEALRAKDYSNIKTQLAALEAEKARLDALIDKE